MENTNKNKETLKQFALFSELEEDQLLKIAAISKVKNFGKNDIVFIEGEEYRGFYIVLKGTVKVYKLSKAGKESVLHIVKPLNAFADVALFEGGNYPVNAQAVSESLLLFIPKNEFIELLEKNVSICLKMLAGFAKRMRSLTKKIEELSLKDVTNRLAEYLVIEIENSNRGSLPELFIKLSVSKSTIAAYLGTITETLSRTFHRLEEENIIRMEGKKIFVLDYPRLKELAKS